MAELGTTVSDIGTVVYDAGSVQTEFGRREMAEALRDIRNKSIGVSCS